MKKHKPLAKLTDNIVQNIKNIESEVRQRSGRDGGSTTDKKKVDIKEFLEDENKRKLLEKTKELYAKLPKSKDDIFKY